ncbi:hypothetical protein CH267_13010 [Rhodococcus sp. 06-621-2]|nr:hypothetical protein CH267_13010 [Rhodococcus sp. 06-621-2]
MASPQELAVLGDARAVVEALVKEWDSRGLGVREPARPWPSLSEVKASMMKVDLGHDPSRGLDLRSAVAAFDERLPAERIIVTDSGRHMAPLPTLLGAPDARSWIVSRGYGSVGLGISAALGAATASTEKKVVLFCGDGGFMMGAQGLDCFRINDLDATIVILNDELYGAEVGCLRKYGLSTDIAHQTLPRIDLYAESLGGRGVVVRTFDDIAALDLNSPGLLFVDVRLDPEVNNFGAVG